MAKTIHISENVKDSITRDIVKALSVIGFNVAMEAYRKTRYGGNWEHRTYNLHDSYGSAVYVNGVLVEDSIRYVNRARSNKRDTRASYTTRRGAATGREALIDFFKHAWIVRKSDSITVVVAAAMWYADILEKKGYEVLDSNYVKSEISKQISGNPQLFSNLRSKYGIDMPTIRRWLGIDEAYAYKL